MTFSDLIKIDEFMKKIVDAKNYASIKELDAEFQGYFCNSEYKYDSRKLCANQFHQFYSDNDLTQDQNYLKNFLESIKNKNKINEEVSSLYDLYCEGKGLKDSYEIKIFLRKVYAYHIKGVNFDKSLVDMLDAPDEVIRLTYGSIDLLTYKEGICFQIKNYCSSLLCETSKMSNNENSKNGVEIKISNVATSNSENNVSIDLNFSTAKRDIEEMALADSVTKEILTKIDELEQLYIKEKSKKTRWEKAKEIIQWVTEQGIQVAGVILPLLGTFCK